MFRPRTITILAFGLLALFQSPMLVAQPPTRKPVPLFNGQNFSGWYKYSGDKKVNAEDLIVMHPFEKYIIIKGTSPGYLMTDKKYSNYELNFEWRWALDQEGVKRDPAVAPARKSGVLFHIAGEGDLIWPKSIEAVLDFNRAGDLFLVRGFKMSLKPERIDRSNNRHFLRSHDGIEKALGEWNQGTIICHDKFVSIKVNDAMMMAGRGAEFISGRIALQSEAGEIHFRNITMRPLEGKAVDPEQEE
ncbi:MAG TPA: DUF1080 domain-containing protein [Gemmatales bacterium]|nr:DUF1080 domain-containing protein [Gemmatales bacterium]